MQRTIPAKFKWYRPDCTFFADEVWVAPSENLSWEKEQQTLVRKPAIIPTRKISPLEDRSGLYRIRDVDEYGTRRLPLGIAGQKMTALSVRLTQKLTHDFLAVRTENDALNFVNKYGMLWIPKPTPRGTLTESKISREFDSTRIEDWTYAMTFDDFFLSQSAAIAIELAGRALKAKEGGENIKLKKLSAQLMKFVTQDVTLEPNRFYFNLLPFEAAEFADFSEHSIADDTHHLSKLVIETQLRESCRVETARVSSNGSLQVSFVPDSLYTWILLQIYETHFVERSSHAIAKECLVCGELFSEHPMARGRQKFCCDAHRKEFKRYGPGGSPARRRVLPEEQSWETAVQAIIDRHADAYGKPKTLKLIKQALRLPGEQLEDSGTTTKKVRSVRRL